MAGPSTNLSVRGDEAAHPATYHEALAADGSQLSTPTRAVFVGGAGQLVCTDTQGNEATYNLPAGFILPLRVRSILPASTCTNIVGWW